jgi:tRNA threonylcarbamoyladenosine biosynthesis protein TsaB
MKLLALETSGTSGSVAALNDESVLQQIDLPEGIRTAESLAPTIQEVLQAVGWQPQQLDLIAVTRGPGSFTGLRVGIVTTKALAYATGARVAGVNTLDVIADQVQPFDGTVWAVIDAQRQQLFASCYERGSNGWKRLGNPQIFDNQDWISTLESGVQVTGPGLKRVVELLPAGVEPVESSQWQPRASTVGRLAVRRRDELAEQDLWNLLPFYFRKSAAEEKRGED